MKNTQGIRGYRVGIDARQVHHKLLITLDSSNSEQLLDVQA